MADGWALALKGIVYILAFWLLGWRFAHRKALPALGWALLGGLARWLAGVVLGLILFGFLTMLGLPFWRCVAFFALGRFLLWAMLGSFLYEPPRKPLLHFASIMTLLNFGFDLLLYGPVKAEEFMQPVRWGGYH